MPDAADSNALHPRWLLVTMIVMSIGYAGLFAIALLCAITSPLVFDSGDTARNWHAFFGLLFFPVIVLISLALSWCGYRFRRSTLIPLGFALPIIYCAAFWFSFS